LQPQVFLRAGKMAELDKRKTEVQHAAASAIQRHVRGHLARKRFAAVRRAVLTLQAAARGMAARTLARSMRRQKAATRIQAHVRRWQAQQRFATAVRAAVAVQAAYRGWKARLYARDVRQHHAALVIQSQWRRHRAQASYLRYRRGVVVAQVCKCVGCVCVLLGRCMPLCAAVSASSLLACVLILSKCAVWWHVAWGVVTRCEAHLP
jgi:myosin-5